MAHILLIDDEELSIFTLRAILEDAGHTVAETRNGVEGLALRESQDFDLVITDMIMPEKEGLQTIIELRQRRGDLPVIAISGGGRAGHLEILELAKQCGANETLTKPFTAEKLLDAVASCLKSAR